MSKFLKLCLFGAVFILALNVNAMDTSSFERLANNTIKQMDSGVVGDIDALIAMQEELMRLGVEGGSQYIISNPAGTKPLSLVIENASKMKELTLDEIEDKWHQGNFFKAKGINVDEIDHFGPVMSLMDSVIHPATSYLLIKEYKLTGNPELLGRVKGELIEVLEHIKHVNESPADKVRLTSNQ